MTKQQVPCPQCRQENPPRNRFCGSCGAPLTSSEQLAMREEYRPVPAGRAWPAKLGPVSKALAVGAAALAMEAGLSWLRHKVGAEDRSSRPFVRGHLSLIALDQAVNGPIGGLRRRNGCRGVNLDSLPKTAPKAHLSLPSSSYGVEVAYLWGLWNLNSSYPTAARRRRRRRSGS
jgi:hypothetical protein